MPDSDVGWSEGPQQTAHSNLAAANGVPPQAAVTAIKRGGPQGIPPSLGMTQPQYVNQVADQAGWSEAVNSHPPVANFVAKSPAHAAAATGSMDQLADVSGKTSDSYFSDVGERYHAGHQQQEQAWGEIGQAAFNPQNTFFNIGGLLHIPLSAIPNNMGPALGAALGGFHLLGGAWNSLVSPATGGVDTFARSTGLDNQRWASIPIPGTDKTLDFGLNKHSLGDIAGGVAGIFVGGSRFGKVRPGEMPPPGEPPTGGGGPGPGPTAPDALGRQPFHTGTAWNTNAEGFLADEEGKPVGFASARDAASWRVKHGGDQVFEPDLHPEGVGLRDVEARPGDPYWEARRSREPVPGMNEQTDEVLSERADHDAETSERIEKAVSETPLHSQAPELMQEFLQGTAVAGRDVQVDPFALRELYNQGHTPFSDRIEDIEDAMFRGTSMTVPYADWLTEVSGKPYAKEVRAATAFSEGGISQAEAKEVKDMHVSPGDTSASLTPGAGFSIKDLPVYTPDQGEIIDRILAENKIEAEDIKQNPIPRGQIPHEVQFGKDQRTNRELREKVHAAHADAKVETVGLSQIRSPQRSITGSDAEKATAKPQESDIRGIAPKGASDEDTHGTLEKYRGEYYVRDGNHRIVKLLSEGKTEGKFSVIDLDKHLETGWRPDPERPAYEPPKDIPKEFHEPLRNIAAQVEGHIDEIFKEQALGKLFENPKAAGMTKAQFERYGNALDDAKYELREKVMQKLYNQIKRERTPDWKAAVELAKEEAIKSLNAHPNIVAYRNLKDPLFRLSTAIIKDQYPDLAAEFPKNLQKKDGTNPDDMAEILNFRSGGDLVKEMILLQRAMDAVGAKSLDSFIKSSANIMAQLRARELAGFDGSPEGIRKEVEQTAAGPAMEDFLIAELKAIKALAPEQPLDLDQIKSKAEDIFGKMIVKDASSIKLAERAVWKTGNATQYALEKGNWVAAFKAKQQQLLNHYILAHTHKFVTERKSFERRAREFAKNKSKTGIPQEYMDRIHSFLQDYGYKVPQNNLRYNYAQWAQEERDAGRAVPPYAPPAATDVSKLTVNDFHDVADRLNNLIHLAKDEGLMKVMGEHLEMELLIRQALDAAAPVRKKPVLPDVTVIEGKLTAAKLNSWMFNPQVMFDILDNRNPNGVFNRVLMQGARRAAVTEHDIVGPEDQAISDVLKEVGPRMHERMSRFTPKGHGLMRPDRPGLEANLTYKDMQGIMIHMGHKEGRWHLEEGGFGWDRGAYEKFIEDNATKDDWELVDKVIGVFNDTGMWNRIVETERELSGLVPEKVQALKITMPNGDEHPGGYFPLRRDDRLSSALKGKVKVDPGSLWAHFLQEGATPKGHTIRRVAATYVPSLDWTSTIQSHIPNVAKRIAYGKWALDALKFISQPEIVKLIEDVHGPEGWNVIRGWLQRQLGYRSIDPRAPAGVDAVFHELRLRTYAATTAWKVSVMLEHITSVAQTASQAGMGTTLRGLVRFFANPLEAEKFAVDQSDYMRVRSDQVTRELRDIIDDIHNNRSRTIPFRPFAPLDVPMNKYREFSGKVFNAINHWLAATPAWTGAYWDAIEGKAVPSGRLKPLPPMEPDEAIAFADKVVSKSHGSGMELDMGTFQSGGGREDLKTLNMYNVFRGTFGSLLREGFYHAFRGQDAEEKIAGWKQALIAGIGIYTIAQIVTDQVPKRMKNLEDVTMWMFDNIANSMSHMFPMGAQGLSTGQSIVAGKPPDFEVSPVEGTITNSGKGAADILKRVQGKKVTDSRALENGAILAGMILNIPGSGQAGETIQVIHDMIHPGKAGRVTRPIPALLFGPSHERIDRKTR